MVKKTLEDTFLYNTNDIESTRGNKPMKLTKRLAGAAISFSLVAGCGEKKEELNIYSWADNFDEQVLRDFEKKYNVKINYDKYASNEEMLAKLQAGGAKYDLIQPSDYMVKTMAKWIY